MKYLLLVSIFLLTGLTIWILSFSQFSPFRQKLLAPQEIGETQALAISEPEDGEVTRISTLKVKGKSKPASYLAAFTNSDSQIVKVANLGEFETNLTLAEGFNQIKLANFESDQVLTELELDVFFLSEKFEKLAKFDQEATQSSKSQEFVSRLTQLRQKKNLKIQAGIIKGILGKNLAIETKSGSRTMVISSNTQIGTYPDFAKKLDFEELQAQDFVVGVGNFTQQGILTAKILLVAPKKPDLTKTTKFGIVNQIRQDNLDLINLQDRAKTTIAFEGVKIFDETGEILQIKNIALGNKLVVVGKLEKEFVAEKILVISGDFLGELEKFATPSISTQSATTSATP